MELYGPTAEQLARDVYEPPQRDQKKNRHAWRKLDGFERMRNLDPDQQRMANKLVKMFWGARGVFVGDDRGACNGPADEHLIHRYGRELWESEKEIGCPRRWQALEMMIVDTEVDGNPLRTEHLGRLLCGYRDRATAKRAGDRMIKTSLETLAYYWGIKQRPPDR